MKLLRWTLAGASFYVIYKYSIGKKAKGKDVFVSPDEDAAEAPEGAGIQEEAGAEKPKRAKTAKRSGK